MQLPILNHRTRAYLPFLLLAALLLAVEYAITQSARFHQQPETLSLAISADLLLTLPGLYYLLVARRLKQGLLSVVLILSLALGFGYWILPPAHQTYLRYGEQALVLAEAGVFGWVLLRLRRILRTYRALASREADFIRNLHEAVRTHLGPHPVIHVLIGEVIMLRYSLFGWLGGPEQPAGPAYSLHRQSGFVALLSMLIAVSLVEAFVAHLLLVRFSPAAAWGLTALSLYSTLFLVAHGVSVTRRQISLQPEALVVRVGMIWNFSLDRATIEAVERIRELDPADKNTLNTARLLLTPPNVRIRLNRPLRVTGLYGIQKTVQAVALVVDEPDDLLAALCREP